MDRCVLKDGEELSTPKGSVALTTPAPGVIVFKMRGHVTAEIVPPLLVLLEKFGAAAGPTQFFYDLWDMHGYDSALRVQLTNFHLRNRGHLRSLHACSQSRLVKMGVAVANVVLGIIVQHDMRSSFEAALRRAVQTAGPASARV
jgi:hypothetical protein